MKLLGKSIEKDGAGFVTLIPEDADDLWHLYNLIAEGDRVQCQTMRKVQLENATGSTSSIKKLIKVKLNVQSVFFDTQAEMLRVKGTNELESENIKLGAHHTAELELQRKISLEKDRWDIIALERLTEATDDTLRADLAAIIMQEGLAFVCLITSTMTITKQKIEMPIPRKRKSGATQHDKAITRFYEQILLSIQRNIRWDIVKCCIVASPGFLKDELFKYLMAEAQRRDLKDFMENKGKFVLCHSSSGFKHSLKEVLQDKSVAARLSDTKAANEIKALEDFYAMLNDDPDRAVYGPAHCIKAVEKDAIDVLLITDSLFRSKTLAERQKFVNLVEKVRETNGAVRIFSSQHVTGDSLAQLTGVAAILRFPCPEIDDVEEDIVALPTQEDEDGENGRGGDAFSDGEHSD